MKGGMTVEDLMSAIVVIIGVVAAIVNAVKKKKQQQARTQFPPAAGVPDSPHAAPAAQQRSMSTAPQLRQEPLTTAQPTVHTHLAPDCDTHDAPGSLDYRSPEGKDPCHVDQLPSTRDPLSEPVAAEAGLQLDWTGENLVKAFVMQEVLTRPCQRHARS